MTSVITRCGSGAVFLFFLLMAEVTYGQVPGRPPSPAGEGKPISLLSRWDYLNRESAVEEQDYWRASAFLDLESGLLNPAAGIEFRIENPEARTYWFGNDIQINDRSTVHVRFNHLEFSDWETAINYINFYYSYHRAWFHGAVGIGYAALIFEGDYQNPFRYESDSPETRIIYDLSVRPTLWKDRLELDLGLRNFDNFEYHGADDNGYHIEPIFHITDRTDLILFYERRYAAVFISVPTLTRTTWMISIQHRFEVAR